MRFSTVALARKARQTTKASTGSVAPPGRLRENPLSPLSATSAGTKFMAGAPIKPATKTFAGEA